MASQSFGRRDFLKSVGLGAAALSAPGMLGAQTTAKNRPNVLLYIVDDQGTGDAGCYGNPAIKTPGLDLLAGEGTRFTNAFCTTASCSASRSVILTGMYNHANGQYGHQHSYNHFISFPDIKSLPVLMGEAGYRTASVGKYHVAPESVYHFQQYIEGSSPEEMADKSKGVIGDKSPDPFFLYFCTHEPHRPFQREGSDPVSPDEVIVPPYLPDTPECREELAKYYMSVQRTDKGLLRLIEILKETGRWENTVIIYLSDNGIAFPGAKTTLYEPGMRLPCVVRSPFQQKKGLACDALVNYACITPTILDFAGVSSAETQFHGRSFLPVLEQESPAGWDETYASHTFHEITMYYPMRVVRGRRFKLIWNIAHGLDYPFASDLWASATWQGVIGRGDKYYGKRTVEAYLKRAEFELYDLEQDPHEVVNLADNPDYFKVLEDYKGRLKKMQKQTGDPWILKWEHE
ncbi:sulfatase [Gemmatimonadota bacterium]